MAIWCPARSATGRSSLRAACSTVLLLVAGCRAEGPVLVWSAQGEGTVAASVEAATSLALRSVTPAERPALARGTGAWPSPGGGVSVGVTARCPPGRRCVAAWDRGGSRDERRARFFAWPIATLALLEFDDQDAALAAANALRERAAAWDS